MKSVRYLLLFLSLFFLASCKEEKPISEDTEKEPEIIEEHVHNLIHHEALEPTCTKSGHNEYDECRICDYSTLTIIPPLGHSYDSGVVTKEASCTEEGIITYTCTRCGDTYTETIEKIEHEYELVEVIEPTYEVEGKRIYKCKVCGDEYSEVIGKKEYLSLSDVTGKDQDITKWNVKTSEITGYNYGVKDSNHIKIILDLCTFNFLESDELITFINDDGKYDKRHTFIISFEDSKDIDLVFYQDSKVIEISRNIEGVTKYYYSYNSFENYRVIKDYYSLFALVEDCYYYDFNPCIDIVEGEKYNLFEVISYILNSSELLTIDNMVVFNLGESNTYMYKSENIKQMIGFFEGEYEVSIDNDYYLENKYLSQRTPSFSYYMDYHKKIGNEVLPFGVLNANMVIINKNDFGFTFLRYKDGEFNYITFKGCFTLEDKDVIGDLFYRLRDEEIQEAEDNGMGYGVYWTKKYKESHNK